MRWRSIELMVACPLKGLVSRFLRFMMQRSQYHLGDLLLGIKVLKGDARMRESKDAEYLIGKRLAN
jgi:hypothetical protein